MKVFNPNEIEMLKDIKPDKSNQGFVYVVEYGKKIKIGSSIKPYDRYMVFKRETKYNMSRVGRIAISCSHSNFRKNEHKLHKLYSKARIVGTELFNLPFDEVVNECWEHLSYHHGDTKATDEQIGILLKNLFGADKPDAISQDLLLTTIVANDPCLLLGVADIKTVNKDVRAACCSVGEIERCIFELGLSMVIPFLVKCRKVVGEKYSFSQKDRIERLGNEIINSNIEIPFELVKEIT